MTDQAAQLVTEEEGPSSALVYQDSRGFATICRGTLVDARPELHAEGLCQAARDLQDAYTLNKARRLAAALPGYSRCSDIRQAVLVSMCFQFGSLTDWPNLRAALSMGDYGAAADAMLDSDWARTQTPTRAKRAAWMMRVGGWLDHGAEVPTASEP